MTEANYERAYINAFNVLGSVANEIATSAREDFGGWGATSSNEQGWLTFVIKKLKDATAIAMPMYTARKNKETTAAIAASDEEEIGFTVERIRRLGLNRISNGELAGAVTDELLSSIDNLNKLADSKEVGNNVTTLSNTTTAANDLEAKVKELTQEAEVQLGTQAESETQALDKASQTFDREMKKELEDTGMPTEINIIECK